MVLRSTLFPSTVYYVIRIESRERILSAWMQQTLRKKHYDIVHKPEINVNFYTPNEAGGHEIGEIANIQKRYANGLFDYVFICIS